MEDQSEINKIIRNINNIDIQQDNLEDAGQENIVQEASVQQEPEEARQEDVAQKGIQQDHKDALQKDVLQKDDVQKYPEGARQIDVDQEDDVQQDHEDARQENVVQEVNLQQEPEDALQEDVRQEDDVQQEPENAIQNDPLLAPLVRYLNPGVIQCLALYSVTNPNIINNHWYMAITQKRIIEQEKRRLIAANPGMTVEKIDIWYNVADNIKQRIRRYLITRRLRVDNCMISNLDIDGNVLNDLYNNDDAIRNAINTVITLRENAI